MYDYYYPVVWSGELEECVITEGKCMAVTGTDVGSQDCFNYNCKNTNIQCPPKGLPVCPGGANSCDEIIQEDDFPPQDGYEYHMQKVRFFFSFFFFRCPSPT
jgi:hypothetical protein